MQTIKTAASRILAVAAGVIISIPGTSLCGQQLLQRPSLSSVGGIQTPAQAEMVYDEATSPRRNLIQPVSNSGSPFGSYQPQRWEVTEMSEQTVQIERQELQQPRIRPIVSTPVQPLPRVEPRITAPNGLTITNEHVNQMPENYLTPSASDLAPAAPSTWSATGRSFVFSSAYSPWSGSESVLNSLPTGTACCDEWLGLCKEGDCCNRFGIFPKWPARPCTNTCK